MYCMTLRDMTRFTLLLKHTALYTIRPDQSSIEMRVGIYDFHIRLSTVNAIPPDRCHYPRSHNMK